MRILATLVLSVLVPPLASAQTRPSAPQLLSASATGTTITIRWSAPASGDAPGGYLIEVGSAAGATNLALLPQAGSATSATVSPVAAGTYFIRARALAQGTSGDPSNEVSVTVAASGSTPTSAQVTGLGQACTSAGAMGLRDGGFLICDAGRWRYAVASDVPVPALGVPTKPAWYPTLKDILGTKATCPASGVKLTYSPIPVEEIARLIPYGMMVSGHVTPIDHGYITPKSAANPSAPNASDAPYVPVVAPAAGVITELSSLGSPTSSRVVIDHGCGIYTVFMVLNKPTGVLAPYADRVTRGEYLSLQLPIEAGQEFGRQRDNPIDFNVFDQATWLPGFATVFPYGMEAWKPYTADPTPYFSPTLAGVFDAVSTRDQAPKWGRIDLSLLGTAGGNWFLEKTLGYSCLSEQDARSATSPLSSGQVPGKNEYAYCHLAFAPHWVNTSVMVASLGWWRDPAGDPTQLFILPRSGQKLPDAITAADGTVVYELTQGNPDGRLGVDVVGVLAVRVNADGTLSVEVLPDVRSASSFTGFSGAERTYRR